ncbi:MAG: phosphoribosylglycinamide formyltransferase [Alloprevotella sp.]|nr:phosphoribosylglycinamide formyltransferase [Alloprevotella sp.]
MTTIAIFVSGNGTNCENIIRHYQGRGDVTVGLVLSNREDAYALVRARNHGIPTAVINRAMLNDADAMGQLLDQYGISFIVLAGFLMLVPEHLVAHYPRRIVNLHPALLPKYGGRGMYGHHVHEAVKAAGERETGITVHYVDAVFDHGEVIAQYRTALTPDDTVEDIERKIHALEQAHFPEAIDKAISLL